VPNGERLVLQTTYLNDHYKEYLQHNNFQLVWVLRNPCEVINSMLHNWSSGALRRLFHACGSKQLDEAQRARYDRFGHWSFSKLDMACYSYIEKSRHAVELSKSLSKDQLRLLDYDQFVSHPQEAIRSLCCFFDVEYTEEVAAALSRRNERRASSKLSEKQKARIKEMCDHSWQQTLKLVPCTAGGKLREK